MKGSMTFADKEEGIFISYEDGEVCIGATNGGKLEIDRFPDSPEMRVRIYQPPLRRCPKCGQTVEE